MNAPNLCGICGENTRLTLKEKFNEYSLWECASCQGQFWTPMKNPGSSWYERDERYSFRNQNPMKRIESNHRLFLDRAPAAGGKILDIGMGIGNFLSAAVKCGYRGFGIDFDRDAISAAKDELGLENVYVEDIDGAVKRFGIGFFDAVTMFEVLEHLDNPRDFLAKIRIILKTGGFLGLSVPFRGSWDVFKKYDKPPRHLSRWNEKSMSNFFKANGFEILEIKVIPASFAYLVTKFHFWSKGFLSFGLVEKISKAGNHGTKKTSAKPRRVVKVIKSLALLKDYLLFGIPAALLYIYLRLIRRHGLTLYALGRCFT
ncbi:MAG TPA: class I SAM-dependent methyltransferase [Candidatus Paceibacterota bacterium]